MKTLRKIIALALVVLLLAGLTALPAFASEEAGAVTVGSAAENAGAITVSLRIEGIRAPLYYNKEVTLEAGASVEDLLVLIGHTDGAPDIVIGGSELGAYVSGIDGLKEGEYGELSGWFYYVNGIDPFRSISLYELNDGDEVVCFYGDKFGVGMQFPYADLSKLYSNGTILFLSVDEEYDDDWNMSLVLNPVAGADVLFNGINYLTNENGGIYIEDKAGMAGLQRVQIEKYDEKSGVPKVLRFAPDHEIYVPFADTPDGVWFEIPVEFSVLMGFFRGADSARNLFLPGNYMTIAQLVTVLGRIAGADVDAPSDPWYAVARDWALDNGIITEWWFESGAGASVTREQFIYLFYLTAALAGSYDMDLESDITIATDFEDISADYYESISWAVASGIIHGMAEDALTINPGEKITRAQVCQMLFNYYYS